MDKQIWDQETRWPIIRLVLAILFALLAMYSYVVDAKPYFGALADHTIILLAGCGATVVLGLLQKYVFKKPLSIKWEITILLGFLFFAGFEAWRDQYRLAMQRQEQITYLSKPELVIEADTEASACHSTGMLTLLGVRVANNGADSAVLDYDAHYQSKTVSDLKIDMVALGLNNGINFKYPDGNTYHFDAQQFLYSKTGIIRRGDFIVGKLPLWIPGDHCKEIADPSTKITLRAKDYTGHWSVGCYQGKPEKPNSGPDMMQGEIPPVLVTANAGKQK